MRKATSGFNLNKEQAQENIMLNNKKKLVYIIIAVLLAIGVAIGLVFIFKLYNPGTTPVVTVKEQADTLKTQAIEAMKNNDDAKAKTLLQEAQQQYKDINDSDNINDTAAQLWAIDHPATTTQ